MTDIMDNANDNPVCTVCIANFNGEHLIEACINSVLKQTSQIKVEIIIHDDASADKSVDFIKTKYPLVKLIESKDNVGFCISNNRMANAAKGQFLLFLNNDATLFEDAIDTLFAAAKSTDLHTIYGLPQYKNDTHELIDCGALLDPFFNAVPIRSLQCQEVAMVAGACLWIPKQLWDEVGGFPEWFESIAEDLYLCCRARLAGYPVIALSSSGYYHWVGNSFGGGKPENNRLDTTCKRRALSERNKAFVMIICIPSPWIFLLLIINFIFILVEGFVLSISNRNFKIFTDIYVYLPFKIWDNREKLLGLRAITNQMRCLPISRWRSFIKWVPYKILLLIKYGLPKIKSS